MLRDWLTVAEERAVAAGAVVRIALRPPLTVPGEGGEVRASSAFVAQVDGAPVAYLNVCRHRAVPLDANGLLVVTGSEGGEAQLVCSAHGARFLLRDGMCVEGPAWAHGFTPFVSETPAPHEPAEPKAVARTRQRTSSKR